MEQKRLILFVACFALATFFVNLFFYYQDQDRLQQWKQQQAAKNVVILDLALLGAEVANGFYVLSAADRDEAVKLASMIPASAVQVRQLAGISDL